MRKVFILWLLLGISSVLIAQPSCPIIPEPVSSIAGTETFLLSPQTFIESEHILFDDLVTYLQQELLRYTGIPAGAGQAEGPAIILRESRGKDLPGSYTIEMNSEQVLISAASKEGMVNGVSSFLQLARTATWQGDALELACWNIEDAPQYAWRGVMLDESRHFYGKEVVKFILDWMAFYKLNRFHWHLTDTPGWRLEIRQYPRLALIGGIGNHSDSLAPAAWYTQKDIAEIVAYAQQRSISIIPEIDMPGHAAAANRAYPAFSGGGSEKYPEFTFHPGLDTTYSYLTNILRETDALFPSQMIHLGGDEVHFGNEQWNTDPDVQHLMKEHKLASLKEVEQYFIRRMADSVMKRSNKVLGWDEIAGTTLPPDSTIIFWWRHDKPGVLHEALQKSYSVVLCPRIPLYFDFVQDSLHRSGRRWSGDFASLKDVYEFSASQVIPNADHRKQVLGIQANLWTETSRSRERLEFLLFPRIAALSEAAWKGRGTTGSNDFGDFEKRLEKHLELYETAGIYYYNPFSPKAHPEVIK